MRSLLVPVILAGLVGVGLVGCSASPYADGSCERPEPPGTAAVDVVDVTGAADAAPRIDAYTPVHADQTQWRDLSDGEGTAIRSDDQLVVMDLTLLDGGTGEEIAATAYDGSLANPLPMSQWTQSFPGLTQALECAREGDRVLTVLGEDGIEPEVAESFGLGETGSAILVADLRKVYLAKADGVDQFVEGNGLPSVVRAPDGTPGVIVPNGEAPDELRVEALKRGDGEVITGDAPVRVAYTGVLWDEGSVFDSTWGEEPVSLTLDGVVPGFAQALEGQTVGSQVLAVIPPDQGYGDQGGGPVPGGATLIFVIDILGIDAPAS